MRTDIKLVTYSGRRYGAPNYSQTKELVNYENQRAKNETANFNKIFSNMHLCIYLIQNFLQIVSLTFFKIFFG